MTNQEANEVTFEIDNDKAIRYTPVPQYGKDVVKAEVIMDKETFIECYEKWIRKDNKECPYYDSEAETCRRSEQWE